MPTFTDDLRVAGYGRLVSPRRMKEDIPVSAQAGRTVVESRRAIQRVLREVNQRDLALALKGASEEVRAKILKNMSSRAAQTLQEEMALLGPQRLRVVEEAQQRIVAVVRALAEAEEIVISRGREDILI